MPQETSKGHKRPREATKGHRKPQQQKRQPETIGDRKLQKATTGSSWRQKATVRDNWRQEERRVLRLLGGYWNIKEWGHFVVRCSTNFFVLRLFGVGRFKMTVAPLRYH
jgi:hypothetical protein